MFWSVPYFQRYHGVDAAEVGSVIGLFMAVGGLIGMLLGGGLADWFRPQSRRAKLYVCFVGWALSLLAAFCMLFTNSLSIAYLCSFIFFLAAPLGQAPILSTISDLMIPRTRAVGMAMGIMVSTFMGFALGPYIIGVLSDTFVVNGMKSDLALQQGMLIGLTPQLVGILFLILAIQHIVADEDSRLDRARALGEKI